MDVLAEIVKKKREEVAGREKGTPLTLLKDIIEGLPKTRDFAGALSEEEGIKIIAELKKASPSAGLIRREYNPSAMAPALEEGGAAALSILTDEGFFQGSLSHIKEAKDSCRLPVLRKDFILSGYQVFESRAAGADAFLLIAALMDGQQLKDLMALGRSLGMASLVEVHTRGEMDAVLDTEPDVVGINNRDLKTFTTDLSVSMDLARCIPHGIIAVSESGIESPKDIEKLREAGIHAFLIGEAIMRAQNIKMKVSELVGKNHTRRAQWKQRYS